MLTPCAGVSGHTTLNVFGHSNTPTKAAFVVFWRGQSAIRPTLYLQWTPTTLSLATVGLNLLSVLWALEIPIELKHIT